MKRGRFNDGAGKSRNKRWRGKASQCAKYEVDENEDMEGWAREDEWKGGWREEGGDADEEEEE